MEEKTWYDLLGPFFGCPIVPLDLTLTTTFHAQTNFVNEIPKFISSPFDYLPFITCFDYDLPIIIKLYLS